ncbi:hypothetical protein CDL15_Pgr007370 [Punica granatum]|uniref:Wax synthase domain-containing protein n=1 Tax=Punica granatum TaxID=22663 RepID=A0A218XAF0_PUNGR|nr:hypothetical protein CDL15_Pgr007370 [Punica granatum]
MVDMEEMRSFVDVWASAVALLCYCYAVAASVPKGAARLAFFLPVFYLLAVLPLGLSSFHLVTPCAFLLAWLCNFKLLLFSFGTGPLSRSPNCLRFILVASLPIDIKLVDAPPVEPRLLEARPSDHPTNWKHNKSRCSERSGSTSPNLHRMVLLAAKALVVALAVHAYDYKPSLHPYLVWALHGAIWFFGIELALAVYAILGWAILGRSGLKLDAQFNEPCLSTSLEDFWGRRWNLTVSRIFRLAIYNPLRSVCVQMLGPDLACYPATIATFTISGLMHEAMCYYFIRVAPTWEVTAFFVIQGGCLVVEKVAKKRLGDSWQPNWVVSWFLTLGLLAMTAVPLLGLPLTRNGVDEKGIRECHAVANFIKEKVRRLISASTG